MITKEFADAYQPFSFRNLANLADVQLTEPSSSIVNTTPLAWPSTPDPRFHKEAVERLLDEAADLLDRGLRDRAEWYNLAEAAFRTSMEVQSLAGLEEITLDEELAGKLPLDATITTAELDALKHEKTLLDNSFTKSKELLDTFYTDNAVAARKEDIKALVSKKWENGHLATLDLRNAAADLDVLVAQYKMAHQELKERQSALEERLKGAKAKDDYETRNTQFKLRRRKVASQILEQRQRESIRPGGALNFPERMDPLKERYVHDFEEARARIFVAARGLRDIFGYDMTTNALPDPVIPKHRFFDHCVIWVRKAISWVVAFSQTDQVISLRLPLRTLLSNQDWIKGLDAGTWTNYPTKFFRV